MNFRLMPIGAAAPHEANADEIRAEFARTGCVVLADFLTPAELAEIRAALDAYYTPIAARALELSAGHDEKTYKFACDVVPWNPVGEQHPLFTRLWHDPRLEAVTEVVLGPGFTAPGSLVMFSVPGGRGQAWHQDCPSEATHAFNLNRLFYTSDVSMDDGAIVIVPGSHTRGRIPPGGHQDPIDGEVALTPRAGTLVLLHGHVYHRVTPNLTPRVRTSVNFRAFPAGVPKTVTCIGVYRNGTVDFCDKARSTQDNAMAMAAQPAAPGRAGRRPAHGQ